MDVDPGKVLAPGGEVWLVLHNWQLFLGVAALAVVVGVGWVLFDVLAPFVRLRRAAGHEGRMAVVRRERERARRPGDAAAVCEEHGHPDAAEVARDAASRERVVRRLELEALRLELREGLRRRGRG